LVPVKVLSGVFRERFLKLARGALGDLVPELPMDKRWVVFCKPTAQGAERVLDYLGRYVHRTALTDHALLHCDDQSVRFSYKDSSTHERKQMTLPAFEFMRRFLQHVPSKGLHRVRAFGLLPPSHREELHCVQLMLGAKSCTPATPPPRPREAPRCPACKTGELRLGVRLTADQCYELLAAAELAADPHTADARAPPTAEEIPRCA
jgi:hypothetical protein